MLWRRRWVTYSLAVCIVASWTTGASAVVAGSTLVVFPTGDPDLDVAAVQTAVDAGGDVLLKATNAAGAPTAFDFGSSLPGGGYVLLTTDVSLRGEAGPASTTIRGGFTPFVGVSWLPVTSSIRNLRFEAPGTAALFATGATGIDFSDNVVENVVGLPGWLPGVSKGQAVWVVGPETVTGEIVIADNVVHDVIADNGYGVALWGFAADARIEDNVITGVNTAGILVGRQTGGAWIIDNVIAPGPQQTEPYGGGNGIIVGNAAGGAAYVERNMIDCVNPWADGILLAASGAAGEVQDEATIVGNRIVMHDSLFGGISLLGSVSNTYVAHNALVGTGAVAFDLEPYVDPYDLVQHNTYVGNNLSGFDSQVVDVLLAPNTLDNLVMGKVDGVIDLGIQNWISGYSRGAPTPTPGLRVAPAGERTWMPVDDPPLPSALTNR